jgi:hypothetical protein
VRVPKPVPIPISHQHAITLDHLIALKVHDYLGFPFRFKSLLLSSPLNLRGLGFPSISRINASLTVSGLHRDLNHHLTPFSNIARISLADWTCQYNHCIHPLHKPYTKSITSPSRQSYIPFSWASAQKTLSRLNISLLSTDMHYLATGDVSLRHLHSQSLHLLPHVTPISSRVFSNFSNNNLSLLSQFGHISFSLSPSAPSFTFFPFPLSFPSSKYFLTRDFPLLLSWFSHLPSLFQFLASPDPSLLIPPQQRQNVAEHSILALASQSSSFSHTTPPSSIATDASTHLLTDPPFVKTTFAVAANNNAFVASLPPARTSGILHGEAYAIAAASVLARQYSLSSHHTTIHTDHLNSIQLLSSNPSSLSLKNHPARSLYRWILNIWQSMTNKPTLSHVRAHTSSLTVPSQLNRLVDHLASRSNSLTLPPPSLPFPTFFMDSYSPFSSSHNYIESNLSSFCDNQLALLEASNLETIHEPHPSSHCFDNTSPPPYPYTKATSSYSMTVQLYLRSGQLDTSLSRANRLKLDQQPWCRFGCPFVEDPHHIFVTCPRFSSLRQSRTDDLHSNISTFLQTSAVDQTNRDLILDKISNLFSDSHIWPARRSLYYCGVLPPFFPPSLDQPRIHTRIAHECHLVSIRLAAQIWATARRMSYTNSHSSSSYVPPSITLPSLIARILPPSPSESYPSLSISFN